MLQTLLNIHAEQSWQQSQADGIPYLKDFPIMAYRPRMVDEPDGFIRFQNLRMFVDNTQFIDDELRRKIFYALWKSDEFLGASVGSLMDWLKYVKSRALTQAEYDDLRTQHLMRQRDGQPATQRQKITALERENIIKPIWTKTTETYSGVFNDRFSFDMFYNTIRNKLRERHEANAVELSNRYVWQIKTEQKRNEEKRGRKIVAAKKARSKRAK
jgi:hypothetical protein